MRYPVRQIAPVIFVPIAHGRCTRGGIPQSERIRQNADQETRGESVRGFFDFEVQ